MVRIISAGNNSSNSKSVARRLVVPLILTGILLAAASVPAQAQGRFGWWSDRFVIYDDPRPELIGRRGITRILSRRGYRVRGPIRRNGRVYIADVRDRRGRHKRVIVDGYYGDIVQVFNRRVARPPANIGRRYSRKPAAAEPRVGSAARNKGRKPRDTVRKRKTQKKVRTVRKPARAIVRKPLAPLVVPQQPASTQKPVTQPKKQAVPKPVAPAIVAPKQAAVPKPDVSPKPTQVPKPVVVPKQTAAPKIEPEKVAPEKLAREKPAPAARQLPERKAAISNGAAKTGVEGKAQKTFLPPPKAPAKVKIEVPKKDPSKKSAAIKKPRIVGPPIYIDDKGSNNKKGVATKPANDSTIIAPLDNPGKRRDVEKPVAVAPLQ